MSISSQMMGALSDSQMPGRKRAAAPSEDVEDKLVERRQKRMIKNRESAARSRARKQAYTNELENKVSRLEEENERLKKQKHEHRGRWGGVVNKHERRSHRRAKLSSPPSHGGVVVVVFLLLRGGSRSRRRPSDAPTIFDKIISKEIPSKVVYEDDKVLAFRDISPQAPTHIIIIPKVKDGLTGLSKAEERHVEILGYLLYVAKLVAKQEGLDDGFRVIINDGPKGCQSVYHLHIHLLGAGR
uniref:HIT domain-containing protein n=1 Tax=Ananas comosus var. bracteatus TaxID=296719 RepID=A0A6V7NFT3_ANACO|nr:unnamed protein product [Ananas comosus var. bracteatus]